MPLKDKKNFFPKIMIMRAFSTLLGKIIIAIAVLVIFAICLFIFNLQTSIALLFFLFPILILLLGKIAELIIIALERVSTGPLSVTGAKTTLLLICYYALFSAFLAFLIENSIIVSLVSVRFQEGYVALIALSLAFLPRVLSCATGMERARSILLAILTPLTMTATIALLINPSTIALRPQTLQFCLAGSLVQPIIGDLTIYFLAFLGIIHPKITFETISLLDLKQLVRSQLETLQWNPICAILKEAKHVNRTDINQKIITSMMFFVEESRRRRAKLARIAFIDTLVESLCSEPTLKEDLISLFKVLNNDQEAEVRSRLASCYALTSKLIPNESLDCISELLNDKDLIVLNNIGKSLRFMLSNNSKAVTHVVKLSLNYAFLDWLMQQSVSLKTEGLITEFGSPSQMLFSPLLQDMRAPEYCRTLCLR
jgi:hypothetical protein